MQALRSMQKPAMTAAVVLALLWLVWGLYQAGRPVWAASTLALGSLTIWIYASARTLAARYLFPGVLGMLVFVAFPLVYTVQIGFTNYSSSHLLDLERARAYLLDQVEVDASGAMVSSLVAANASDAAAGRVQVVLRRDGDAQAPVWVSPPVSLAPGQGPLSAVPLKVETSPLAGQELSLREVIAWREGLQRLQLLRPDGVVLSYAGVREFAPVQPAWKAQPDGALVQQATQQVFRPNAQTGYFETASGERMLPGFKSGVGWEHYRRLLGDADIRGPFVSIFIWTVVFAGMTVLLATALGMALAVVLNWEALKHRTLYRTLLFLPYAVPGFISILVFKGLFNQNFGEINAILDAIFGVRPAWFADPLLAKVMILIVNTWLGYPYIMVLCTGLIKAIPADLYEASAVAGAGPWANFWRITLPLILKPLTPLLISAFAFNFNNFVLISLLTDGRPDYLNTKLPAGTTDILVSYTYRIAFTDSGQNFGLAAAISTLIFVVVALMALVQLRFTQAPASRQSPHTPSSQSPDSPSLRSPQG